MDLIIILYFAYAMYKASLTAAVNSYGLARGRDVTVGGGDRARTYSGAGRTLGTVLGVLWQSLVEGWHSGRPWAREQAEEFRARRAAKRAVPTPDTRTIPPPDTHDLDENGIDPQDVVDDDEDDEDDGVWRCARCGAELDENSSVRYVDGGAVCGVHFDTHCAACGHSPRDGDPLVLDGGAWVHRSHVKTGVAVDLDDAEWIHLDPVVHVDGYGTATGHTPRRSFAAWTTTTRGANVVAVDWAVDDRGAVRTQTGRVDRVGWEQMPPADRDLWDRTVAANRHGDPAEIDRVTRRIAELVNDHLGIDAAGNPTTPTNSSPPSAALPEQSAATDSATAGAPPRLALVPADPAGGWASVRTHRPDGGA
ncbi:hypothetical protein [Frankia sp. Cppng1_Ct_nod]|uniref:hypothetical protein n=1 Tax=Frankia sp. Cppng1_Ct_nod TaxID=2897162 RepID=UPI001041870D|nr:hypothetical protein [Frankia sp. Cppng1_Ct_nod]